MEEGRASQVGALAEIESTDLDVSQVGALAEIESTDLLVSQVGALAEIIDVRSFISQAGALVELEPVEPYPVRTLGNVQVIFDGNNITGHLDAVKLSAAVSTPYTTVLSSTVDSKQPGLTKWVAELGGFWSKALDDIIGPEMVTPPEGDSLKTCEIIVGQWNHQVGYWWTEAAFVSRSRTEASVDVGMMRWEGEITLSGSPLRDDAS